MDSMRFETRKLVAAVFFSMNLIFAVVFLNSTGIIVDLLGSTSIPFLIYVLPGLLYYHHSSHYVEGRDFNRYPSLIFSIFGFLLIALYSSITIFFSTSNTS